MAEPRIADGTSRPAPIVADGTSRPAPIVAELGRPETPEETAARKAENSRKHRANQTFRNLIWSLVATLVVVLLLVLVVVRPDPDIIDPVDYGTVAEQAQGETGTTLASPALPPEWTANKADLTTAGDVQVWYIGFVTPKKQFVALNQGIDGNPTWVDNTLDGAKSTGTTTIDGIEWTIYDRREKKDPGNVAYAMVTTVGDSTYVLNGTADDVEFETLATALGLHA